ncbi:MAG: GNAT family N-acetyltransferase [Planctomycetaceae bacterium]|jgi:ribosomal protein S18 acetylase RimI-like enzyme|nr:GNAT family N-acetyltransferase [Planctomycetaceae bacterium]
MPFVYVKRYQMVIDLRAVSLSTVPLSAGFHFLEWHPAFLERHAKTKYLSFCNEIDARIFPTFRQYDACLRLMQSISGKPGFLPQATWLIAKGEPFQKVKDCATIQGIQHNLQMGAIQNVAVIPEFRRLGLGRALVLQALYGFQNAGTENVTLEVTAENINAVNLYNKLGFKIVKSVYKETVM